MNYYEVVLDETIEDEWHLEGPVRHSGDAVLDFWPLISGEHVEPSLYRDINAPIQYKGRQTNFTLGAYLIPYVSQEIADVVRGFAPSDVALLPCLIGGADSGFQILVVEKKLKCLDMERSEVSLYEAEDLESDDKRVGTLSGIVTLVIDPRKVDKNDHIFRLEEELSRLIISSPLKDALESKHVAGVEFIPV